MIDQGTERQNQQIDPPEPEGIDTNLSTDWGEYPLDAVFVRTEARTVVDVVRRIKAGRYQLDPDFQRDFVWPKDKQSRLIESCLMRIPLPVFYVAEAKDGRIIVVDGLQRLTTFTRFLNNDFALTGLDDAASGKTSSLSGKTFKDLPVNLQERIEDTPLTLYILDSNAPERARLDIFDRVNSGVPLSRQQMRNSLYSGPATRWLKDAATDESFLKTTGGSLSSKTMRDREAVNRFCAFRLLGHNGYRGDMDSFLANTLEVMNDQGNDERDELRRVFERSMKLNYRLFEEHAFRKSILPSPSGNRSVINIALFDVCAVLLPDLSDEQISNKAEDIREATRSLLRDETFVHAITYSTNSTRQVQDRFRMMTETLGKVTAC